MSPLEPPISIPDHDDTAFRILGAHVLKERRLAAERAAAEAAEKAKREAERPPAV